MHTSISESKIILNHNILKMKFKLIKDKEFFQIVCDKKSVKEIIDWDSKAYEIEWYASTKDKDRMNDIVEPSAFEDTIKQYMTNPIVLLQHDMDKPIGNVIEASIDDKWLFIKARITEDTDGVFSKLKNWVLRTFSIWYRVKDFETEENTDAEWNYVFTNIIKALELFEISLVSVPANPFALVKSFDSCFAKEEEPEEEKVEEEKEEFENIFDDEEKVEEPKEEEIDAEKKDNEEKEDTEEEKDNEQESEESAHTDEEWAENEEKLPEAIHWNVEIHKENESEEWKVIEWEVVEWEEVVEDEDVPLDIQAEVPENKEADENSEISAESDCDDSENDSETESNDESNGETNDAEVVEESKSIEVEHKSFENAEFKTLESSVKSLYDKLDEKDAEIKALKTEVANQNELLKWAIEVMLQLDHAVKNTAIMSWSSYQAPATKNNWPYGKLADLIKKANS